MFYGNSKFHNEPKAAESAIYAALGVICGQLCQLAEELGKDKGVSDATSSEARECSHQLAKLMCAIGEHLEDISPSFGRILNKENWTNSDEENN